MEITTVRGLAGLVVFPLLWLALYFLVGFALFGLCGAWCWAWLGYGVTVGLIAFGLQQFSDGG
jgi:hypothetical protein